MIPAHLKHGPITLDDVRAAGLTRSHVRGRKWIRISHGMYVWSGLRPDPMLAVRAALRRLPPGSAFSGLTAAWLHGIDVEPLPIEATIPLKAGVSARAGMKLRRAALRDGDVVDVRGVSATSTRRTIADVAGRSALTEAVVVADAMLNAGLIGSDELHRLVESSAGRPGIRGLRRVVTMSEPAAESPMESRLRMLLVLAGLPRPAAQVSIHDDRGRFVGRPDLYYEGPRLGIEYDGAIHRTSLAEDNRRQNLLLAAGVQLLRFTAADVTHRKDAVVSQVRAMLLTSPIAGRRTPERQFPAPIAGKRRMSC